MSLRTALFAGIGSLLGLAILAGWTFAQRQTQTDVAELLPAESVIYVGIDGAAGHQQAFEKTAAYQAIHESGLANAFQGFLAASDRSEAASQAMDVYLHLQEHGLSGSISFHQSPNGVPLPWGVAVAPNGWEGVDLLADLVREIPDLDVSVEQKTIRGRDVRLLIVPGSPAELGWWAEGRHLVVAFGFNAIQPAIAVAEGERENITTHPLWKKYRGAQPPEDIAEGVDVTNVAWFDFASFRQQFGETVLPLADNTGRKVVVNDLLTPLGFDQFQSKVYVGGYLGESLWSDVIVDAPQPHRGLLKLFDQPSMTLDDLPPVPQQNQALIVSSFDWSQATQTVHEMIDGLRKFVPQQFQSQIQQHWTTFEDKLDFPLHNLFDSLGNVNCLIGDGSQGGFGWMTVTSVRDRQTLQDCLDNGLRQIEKLVEQRAPGALRLVRVQPVGRTIYRFEFPQVPLISPTVGLGEKWMVVGLNSQTVDAEFRRIAGELPSRSIADDLQDALKLMPDEFTALSVIDPRDAYGAMLSSAPMLLGMLESGLRNTETVDDDFRFPIVPSDIPPAELVTQPLFPNVSMMTSDERGFHAYSRKSMPNIPMLSATGGVLVALLLPAVQQAREAARRTQSRNNLKQIGLGLHVYHERHGHFPQGTISNAALQPAERLSWLVSLLPDVDQQALYNRFDLKTSWDAPENEQVTSTVVPLFINPSQHEQIVDGHAVTHYVGMAGLGADAPTLPLSDDRVGMFGYNRTVKISDVTDGTSNTVMVTDASTPHGAWAAGGASTIRALTEKPYINGPDGIGSPHVGGVNMMFGDGSVRFVSEHIDPTVMEAMATIHGGEEVDF